MFFKQETCQKCSFYKHDQIGHVGEGDIMLLFDTPKKAYINYVQSLLNNNMLVYYCLPCAETDKYTLKDIKCCRPILAEKIKSMKPKTIICFGDNSLKSIYGDTSLTLDKTSKYVIPNYDFKCNIISVPYLEDFLTYKNEDTESEFKRCLLFAVDHMQDELKPQLEFNIELLTNDDEQE